MSLLGRALELLGKYGDVVGFDRSKGLGLLDKLPNLGVLSLASSPIIAGAQLVINGMKLTTGSGEPEDGEAFKKSGQLYEEAGHELIQADVNSTAWDGTAAETYKSKNDEHRHQVLEVAVAEQNMQRLLSALAARVTATRNTLDDRVKFLSDYDAATSWMNSVAGGAAVKAISDIAVAAEQTTEARIAMARLVAESVSTSFDIRNQIDTYQKAAELEFVDSDDSFPCGEPFGDERTRGTLPRRTEADTPYTVPDTDEPPVEYPPATPYGVPR
ncbi:EspA/EspE family type VII secretion system effector [Mycolicibacterium goodii]|uniref:ESX-1 secretion-associated protein EspA/EspE-like domain-containing protein n=1 Tax=Mycolicibacterium goodii TaxID=134601 RepID=A0A0K0X5J2_MYCGD|nr:hypothetical protein AFA91_13180 [Mycolicibacterium goodii]